MFLCADCPIGGDNAPIRYALGSQNIGEELLYFYSINNQKCPDKMIACSGGRFYIFTRPKSGQFYMAIRIFLACPRKSTFKTKLVHENNLHVLNENTIFIANIYVFLFDK